ncbi:hypothetical protein R1sor_009730 [Riccia sorocarpa]|uniref:Reverse transcriptase n=1 Tax=Riccia sorocarpa TaxID=122646 RepID=A0ABD3HZB4_9MARC
MAMEKEIRQKELTDAKSWRIRSRVRWMTEGEAPMLYFFAQLKAKYTMETIRSIRDEQGRNTRSEAEIKEAVTSYSIEQFQCPVMDPADVELRKEVLKLVDKTVSVDQNRVLTDVSSEKEVDELVAELPRDKTPRMDGVTNNGVRQGCPVAPYLFVLSTQPLMLMFDQALKEGKIEELTIWKTAPPSTFLWTRQAST